MTDLLDFDTIELADVEIPPPDDAPPPDTGGGPDPTGQPLCEECGTVIPWSGRGRKPKRCGEHKLRRSTPSVRQSSSRGSRADKRLEALESDLTREFAIVGTGLSKFAPTAGVTVVKRAERTVQALLRVAESNPKLLDALESAARVAPALDLGEFAMAVGLALMVDAGRIKPDAVLPVMLGVSETWHELNPDDEEPEEAGSSAGGFPVQHVPPRFQVIS